MQRRDAELRDNAEVRPTLRPAPGGLMGRSSGNIRCWARLHARDGKARANPRLPVCRKDYISPPFLVL